MAISQMNSFFSRHHRIIFGVITVIIIVAFTDFLTPGTGIVETFRSNRASYAGEIFGRRISYVELNEQSLSDMIANSVFMGVPMNRLQRDELTEQAFYTLATLTAAKNAGISVSDAEVTRFLRLFFRDEKGKFSSELYRNFVANFLAREGFSEADLERAARNYLTLAKLSESIANSIITTPGELESFYNLLNERFEILLGNFKAADYLAAVKLTEPMITEYFNANRKKYMIPASMQAILLAFPYENFRTAATAAVDDAAAEAFYKNNPALFTEIKDNKSTVKPFAAVKAEAKRHAVIAQTRELAMREAQLFAGAAYELVGGTPKTPLATFQKLVADKKLKPIATGRFNANASSIGTLAEPELIKELATVFPDVPVTNAVAGKTGAYVGYVTELIVEREATLAEKRAAVLADLTEEQALEMARKRAFEVSANLQALPAAGRVARAAAAKNPAFVKVPEFSQLNPPLGQLPFELLGAATDLPVNGVSKALPTPDGASVIVMTKRLMPKVKYQADGKLDTMFRNYRLSLAQTSFQAYLSANCSRYQSPAAAQPDNVAE